MSCARVLAENDYDVLVLDRKSTIGPKVCAGGITWSGLINKIPGQLEEKRFLSQHINTRFQTITIQEQEPIIATVNRARLGQHMARIAVHAGAKIKSSCHIQSIKPNSLVYLDKITKAKSTITFDYLIGADGSTSLVRRFLQLPTEKIGIGINYQIPRYLQNMEWHLNNNYFGNGYGWIFPHSDSVSIGAYADKRTMSAKRLRQGLLIWSGQRGFDLSKYSAQAEYINFDYRGWKFDNIYLAGDAAGFASGLTGEGIYPAIISGEYIGSYISGLKPNIKNFNRLIRMNKLHSRIVQITGSNQFLSELLAESLTLGLRTGLLDFRKLEMAR